MFCLNYIFYKAKTNVLNRLFILIMYIYNTVLRFYREKFYYHIFGKFKFNISVLKREQTQFQKTFYV